MRFPLVGPRLELRPFALADVTAIHRVYGDERVMAWVGNGVVSAPAQTKAMLREYIDHQRHHGFSFWAVIERSGGELIGDGGLYTRGGDVELGYTLAYRHWGKGYGTEVARLCVETAFGKLGIQELIALVQPANARSAAVLAKLGFTPAGVLSAYGAPHKLYRLRRETFDHA